jgi:hypothetical protein
MMALADLLKSGSVDGDESSAQVPDDASELTGAGPDSGAPADDLPPDPQPSRRSKQGRRRMRSATTTASKKATAAEKNAIRDALTMLYTLPAWGLQMRDPHCGGALMTQRDAIVDALVPIVSRNPAMVAFFTAGNAPWMEYLALFQALLPVGQMVWGHHVTHAVGGEADGMGPGAGPGMAGGVPVDLSAYAAPSFR